MAPAALEVKAVEAVESPAEQEALPLMEAKAETGERAGLVDIRVMHPVIIPLQWPCPR